MTRTFEIERRFPGTPDDVFAYFVEPDKHVAWQGIRAELDARPGGEYTVHMSESVRVSGRYVEVERPSRIVLAWGIERDEHAPVPLAYVEIPPGSTNVELLFIPDGDHTIVRVIHSNLPSDAAAGFTGFGWVGYLERLSRVTSGADAGPDPFKALMP